MLLTKVSQGAAPLNGGQLARLVLPLEERIRNDEYVQEAVNSVANKLNLSKLFRYKLAYAITKAAYPQSVAHCLAVGQTHQREVIQLLYRKDLDSSTDAEYNTTEDPISILGLDTDKLRECLRPYEKVYVVAVYGKQGDGKSTLCNILSGAIKNTDPGFEVGHFGKETTFGVFGTVIPHPNNSKLGVLLLDAEGCGVDYLRTSQVLFLVAIAAGGLVFNFGGTLPGIRQVTLDSFNALNAFLQGVNGNSERIAGIFSNMIVLQRDAGNLTNPEALQELWREHISSASHTPDPCYFLNIPTPALETGFSYPEFWHKSSNDFKAGVYKLCTQLGLLLINPDISAIRPEELITLWERHLQVSNCRTLVEGLSNDGLDLSLEATLKRTLERDVAASIRRLPLPVSPGQLRNLFNHLCEKHSVNQCAKMLRSSKGNEIVLEARVKLMQENVEKYAEKVIRELKELQENKKMDELLARINSAFYDAVQFLLGSQTRTKLLGNIHRHLDEPLKQIRDSLPVEYRVKLNVAISIPPLQAPIPQCGPLPPPAMLKIIDLPEFSFVEKPPPPLPPTIYSPTPAPATLPLIPEPTFSFAQNPPAPPPASKTTYIPKPLPESLPYVPEPAIPPAPTHADVIKLRGEALGNGKKLFGAARRERRWKIYDANGVVVGEGRRGHGDHTAARNIAEAQALQTLQQRHQQRLRVLDAELQKVKETNAEIQRKNEKAKNEHTSSEEMQKAKIAATKKAYEEQLQKHQEQLNAANAQYQAELQQIKDTNKKRSDHNEKKQAEYQSAEEKRMAEIKEHETLQQQFNRKLAEAKAKYETTIAEIKEINQQNLITNEQAEVEFKHAEEKQKAANQQAQDEFDQQRRETSNQLLHTFLTTSFSISRPHIIYALMNKKSFKSRSEQFSYVCSNTGKSVLPASIGLVTYLLASAALSKTGAPAPVASFGAGIISNILTTFYLTDAVPSASSLAKTAGWSTAMSYVPGGFFANQAVETAADILSCYLEQTGSRMTVEEFEKYCEHAGKAESVITPTEWSQKIVDLLFAVYFNEPITLRGGTPSTRKARTLNSEATEVYLCHLMPENFAWDRNTRKIELSKNLVLAAWTKPCTDFTMKRGIEGFKNPSQKGLGFCHPQTHDIMTRALLTDLLGAQAPPLLRRVLGACCEDQKMYFLEEHVDHIKFLSQENVKHGQTALCAASHIRMISDQLVQIIFGLAQLQSATKFTANVLLPSDFSILWSPSEIEQQLFDYVIDGKHYSLACEGAIVKLDRCPIASAEINNCERFCWSGNDASAVATEYGFQTSKISNIFTWNYFSTKNNTGSTFKWETHFEKEFSDVKDIHMLFRQFAKTYELDLWRNPMVTAFFAEEHKLHSMAREMGIQRTTGLYDASLDMFPVNIDKTDLFQFYHVITCPPELALLSARQFAHKLAEDSCRLLVDASLPSEMIPMNQLLPPTEISWAKCVEIPSQCLVKNTNAWWKVLHEKDMPNVLFTPSLFPVADCFETLCSANANECLLEVGTRGDKIFRGKLKDSSKADGIPVTIKHFNCSGPSANQLPPKLCIRPGKPKIICGEAILETSISILASYLYETGISPHFTQVYGAYQCHSDQVFLVSEYLDGGSLATDFDKVIARLQFHQHQQQRPVANREVYIHNAYFQVVAMIASFQEHLKGMHTNLHLGNIMVKYCDETLFNGKRLCDYEYFEYEFKQEDKMRRFKLPNLGFIVKMVDFGLASVSLSVEGKRDSSGTCSDPQNETRIFGLSARSESWNVTRAHATIPFIAPTTLQRWADADRMRKNSTLRPAMDLQTVGNHFSSHPLFHRNSVTITHEQTEILAHSYAQQDLVNLDIPFYCVIFKGTCLKVPKDVFQAKLEPFQFLLEAEFTRYWDKCAGKHWQYVYNLQMEVSKLKATELFLRRIEQGDELPTRFKINEMQSQIPDEDDSNQ